MFDFFSNQIVNLVTMRRPGGPEDILVEARRLRDLDVPKAPVARAAVTGDQVLLSAAVPGPVSPLPIKPSEPVETGNRVGEVLRRLREERRKTGDKTSGDSTDPSEETPNDPPAAGHLDRWV